MTYLDRAFPRVRTDLRVELPEEWIGDVSDVSATGMRVRGCGLLPVGAEISVAVHGLGSAPVKVAARVVWVKPMARGPMPLEMGIALTEISPRYVNAVAHLFSEMG